MTWPLLPEEDVDVSTVIELLVPALPALLVCMDIWPLVEAVLPPLVISMIPPVFVK